MRRWNVYPVSDDECKNLETPYGPFTTYRSPTIGSFKSIDYHRAEPQFATASDSSVDVWSPERSSPIQTFSDLWGNDDTVNTVRYNPAERSLLAVVRYAQQYLYVSFYKLYVDSHLTILDDSF